MTVYSSRQIIALVLHYAPHVGDNQLFNGLCVALAESGGDLNIISHSHDYGLWQINIAHFGDGIIDAHNWTHPSTQFYEMWKLSSGMRNWAAWCTAWRQPKGNCGHGNLPNIQAGSAAWAQRDQASAAIDRYRGTPPPGQAPPGLTPTQQDEKAVSEIWRYVRNYYGHVAPAQLRALRAATKAIARLR